MPDFSTPAGCPTDHATVLQAVVDRLRSQIPDLKNPRSCFVSLAPQPRMEQRQGLICTVCPMGGQFDEGFAVGSGLDGGACEQSGVIVTAFSQMRLDSADADESLLMNQTRGLMILKKRILKALVGHKLLDKDSRQILLDPIHPLSSNHPEDDDSSIGRISISFATNFIWNLS